MYDSVFHAKEFSHAVVLITGGGTGIGRTIAHELCSLGATVVIAGKRVDVLEKTATEIREWQHVKHDKVHPLELYLRSGLDKLKQKVQDVVERAGLITHLVNNAGGQFASAAAEISERGFRAVIDVNLTGTWNMCRTVYDVCIKNNLTPTLSIVSIIVAMQNVFPMMAHSGAARAGVGNFTKTLDAE